MPGHDEESLFAVAAVQRSAFTASRGFPAVIVRWWYETADAAETGEGFAVIADFMVLFIALGAGFLAGYATRHYVAYRRKAWCFLPNGKSYRQT